MLQATCCQFLPWCKGGLRQYLGNWRGDHWIRRCRLASEITRSSPFGFLPLGFCETRSQSRKTQYIAGYEKPHKNVFQTIRRETLSNVRETFIRRLNLCLEQNRQIFEHLVG
jgi:hypothetical protein